MKKVFLLWFLLPIIFLSFSVANSQLDESISWMNKNWLTKFTNAEDFMSEKSLRRDEAAKFFVQYAKEILRLIPDETKIECNWFNDLSKWRSDLKETMKDACKLGLFQWTNGKFMPSQSLTNAQAITVLIRMIDGKKDESQWYFAQKYFEKAQELWITTWLTLNSVNNFDKLTSRWEVWILLYNAFNIKSNREKTEIIAKEIPQATWNIKNKITYNISPIWQTQITERFYLTKWIHNFTSFYRWSSTFYITLRTDKWTVIDYIIPKPVTIYEYPMKTNNININILTGWDYFLDINANNNQWEVFIDSPLKAINDLYPISLESSNRNKNINFYLQKWEYKVRFHNEGKSNFIVHLLDKDWILIWYLANEIWTRDWVSAMTISSDWYYNFDVLSDWKRNAEISPRN